MFRNIVSCDRLPTMRFPCGDDALMYAFIAIAVFVVILEVTSRVIISWIDNLI